MSWTTWPWLLRMITDQLERVVATFRFESQLFPQQGLELAGRRLVARLVEWKSQERVGPRPNQRPLPYAAFAMANTDYDSLRILRMCTSEDRQETGWTIMGTFSEKGQGLPWQPPDSIGGRRCFRTTDPLLVR